MTSCATGDVPARHLSAMGNHMRHSTANHTQSTTYGDTFVESVDAVLKNLLQSSCHAKLFVLGESEAVIRMVMKGGSPNVRHVDWLLEISALDPAISIRYVRSNERIADSWFTHDLHHTIVLCLSAACLLQNTRAFSVVYRVDMSASQQKDTQHSSKVAGSNCQVGTIMFQE